MKENICSTCNIYDACDDKEKGDPEMSYCSKYDNTPVPEPEEINASEVSQLIHLSAEQTWAFEQGLKVGKEMVEDNKHKEQIKAINSVQKELHELNKTLKLIAGRLR